MGSEKRWLLFGAIGIAALLGFVLFTPKKEEVARLWRKSLTALEYQGPSGPVRIEKESGWFEDRFFVTTTANGITTRRPGAPSVKGIFTDFEAPTVKAEYMLTEAEAAQRFADQTCIKLVGGGDTTLCAGPSQNMQTPVRLLSDPQRIYLLPDHIFSRLTNDPSTLIERRIVILPTATVPDALRITGPGGSLELFRKKQASKAPDGSDVEVPQWFRKTATDPTPVPTPTVMTLLTALYGLQRDPNRETKPSNAKAVYTIELDVVVEGPSAGGTLQRLFGDRTLSAQILPAATGSDGDGQVDSHWQVKADNFVDSVDDAAFDRFTDALNSVSRR